MEINIFLEPLKDIILGSPVRSKLTFADFEDKFSKLPKNFKPEEKSTSELVFSEVAFEAIAKSKAGTPAVTTLIAKPDLFRSSKGRGMEFGSFTHKVMEVLSFALNKGLPVDLDAIISKVAELEDYSPEAKHKDDLKIALNKFLKSETAKVIKEAKNIYSEISFSLPTEYHGIIDLVVETKDGPLIVIDFKTDVLADSENDKEIKAHYKMQIEHYVKAVTELTQKHVSGECCYLF
jgi:ATP-dependent exoDNAse (exonuclease V) beta subunit